MALIRIGIRNLLRNRRRSLITILTAGLGSTIVLLSTGFMDSSVDATSELVREGIMGEIQIHGAGYKTNISGEPYDFLLPYSDKLVSDLEAIPGVDRVAPRLDIAGTLTHNETRDAAYGARLLRDGLARQGFARSRASVTDACALIEAVNALWKSVEPWLSAFPMRMIAETPKELVSRFSCGQPNFARVLVMGIDPVREAEVLPRFRQTRHGRFLGETPDLAPAEETLPMDEEIGDAVGLDSLDGDLMAISFSEPIHSGRTEQRFDMLTVDALRRGLDAFVGDDFLLTVKGSQGMEQLLALELVDIASYNFPSMGAGGSGMIWTDVNVLRHELDLADHVGYYVLSTAPEANVEAIADAAEKMVREQMGDLVSKRDALLAAVAEDSSSARRVLEEATADDPELFAKAEQLRALEAQLPLAETWRELMPDLEDDAQAGIATNIMIVAVLMVVVAFAVLNTAMMSVMERRQEIGTLTALGYRRRQLLGLFLTEGVAIGLAGALVGIVLGSAGLLAMNQVGIEFSFSDSTNPLVLRPTVSLTTILLITFLTAGVALLATLLPARRAARMRPAEALASV